MFGYTLSEKDPNELLNVRQEKARERFIEDLAEAWEEDEISDKAAKLLGSSITTGLIYGIDNRLSFGITLCRLSGETEFIDVSKLQLSPSPEQLALLPKLIDLFPEDLRSSLLEYGPPKVFIMWTDY
jgi:predicted metallo-beta-lactamase superfamily hydrolase